MGGLTSPPVLSVGSSAGQIPEATAAATNNCTDGYNIGYHWTNEGAPVQNTVAQFDNGFVPVGLQTPNGVTSRMVSAVFPLYTTTSVPALPTDRINCFSVYMQAWQGVNPSPQCRFEATLLPSGKVVSVDVNPITGVLIAQAGNPTFVAVERIVSPLINKVENVALYRASFALDIGTDTTAQLRCYPRTDGIAAGVAIFGGAQAEGMVSHPTPFITFGTRQAGNAPRQVSIPNFQQRIINVGVYNVDPISDEDTWLQCNLLAGNTITLPTTGTVLPDAPTGSRLLITQSPTAIGGITTVTGAANAIIAPGGITASYTTLTFPSTDFPNVTQMLLIKTNVTNQWQILETSAGGSGSGGLFLQAGAGAVLRTFQAKDRETVSNTDFGASSALADNSVNNQKAIDSLLDAGTTFYHGSVYLPNANYPITNYTYVRPNTRGMIIQGDGERATILNNTNTAGNDTIRVGDLSGTTNYNVALRCLQVEGNGADGVGIKYHNSLFGAIEHVFVENTGGNGFEFDTTYESYFRNLHARRAGWGGGAGVAGVAGFKLSGNNAILHTAMAEECGTGLIGDTAGVEVVELDTENNKLGGVKIIGASNFTAHRSYAEQIGGSNDNWTIGDGVNAIAFARLLSGSFGNAAGVYFAKTNYYEINDYIFSHPYGQINITDPANTRGRIGNIYFTSLDSAANNYSASYQHNPDAAHTGNLIRNGSFEYGDANFTFQGWSANVNGSTTVASFVAGIGLDRGANALQLNVTDAGASGGYVLSPTTLPTLRIGYVYTLAIGYKSPATAGIKVNIVSGGVTHQNFTLPLSATPRIQYLTFKAQGALTTLNFTFSTVDTFVIDAISLTEGPIPADPTLEIDNGGAEFYSCVAVKAVSSTQIHAAAQTYNNVTAFDGQPDYPRNVTTTGSATAAAGNITVSGMDCMGRFRTEVIPVAAGATTSGNIAWMRITNATGYDAGAGETASIGIGSKFGMPKSIDSLLKGNQNSVDNFWTINTTYNTIDVAPIAANDNLSFWYVH